LLEKLRARGLDLQFSRLRLSWYHGIVAENVRFERADEPLSPHLTLAEVRLRFNHAALARLQFQIDSLMLRQGRLVWPLAETNQAPRQLAVENIQTDLRFLPGDQWALDHFTAGFAGAKIQLSGLVTNASAFGERKFLQAQRATPANLWQNRLRQVADTLEGIRFLAPPDLRLDVRGDARDLASFGVRVFLSTPGAVTPWGSVARGRLSARLFPATANGLSSAEVNLEADQAQTRWATTVNLQLTAHLASFEGRRTWAMAIWLSPLAISRLNGAVPPMCSSRFTLPRWRGRQIWSTPTWLSWLGVSRPSGRRHQRPVQRSMGPCPDQCRAAERPG